MTGVASGVSTGPLPTLDGVSPTLTYYSAREPQRQRFRNSADGPRHVHSSGRLCGQPNYTGSQSAPVTFTIAKARPTVTVADAGGPYDGMGYVATATVAGVVSGIDAAHSASLEGVAPTLTYYSGNGVGGNGFSTAPSATGRLYGGGVVCRQRGLCLDRERPGHLQRRLGQPDVAGRFGGQRDLRANAHADGDGLRLAARRSGGQRRCRDLRGRGRRAGHGERDERGCREFGPGMAVGLHDLTATYGGKGANLAGSTSAILPSSMIATTAGGGGDSDSGDGGQATAAQLSDPQALAADEDSHLFVSEAAGHYVREIDLATGTITTVAGNGERGLAGNLGKAGPATAACLENPYGVAVDAEGDLFIADSGNSVVREVNLSTGTMTTVAGNGNQGSTGDNGLATAAELCDPMGVAVDSAGHLFIADSGNNRIREVNLATGVITTVAGNGAMGAERGRRTGHQRRVVVSRGPAPSTDTGTCSSPIGATGGFARSISPRASSPRSRAAVGFLATTVRPLPPS